MTPVVCLTKFIFQNFYYVTRFPSTRRNVHLFGHLAGTVGQRHLVWPPAIGIINALITGTLHNISTREKISTIIESNKHLNCKKLVAMTTTGSATTATCYSRSPRQNSQSNMQIRHRHTHSHTDTHTNTHTS